MEDWLSFGVLAVLAVLAAAAIAQRESNPVIAKFLLLGVALRIVGSTARHYVLFEVYSGVGDAVGYFGWGVRYAAQIAEFDFSFLTSAVRGDTWWGTDFVRKVTGFVIFFVGPSIRAGFLAFSLLAFVGLVLIVRAFALTNPRGPSGTFAAWAFCMPSLWFWPASIGKEALMMLATGLCVRGYVAKSLPGRWGLLLSGCLLAGSIRPHVAVLLAASVVLAEVLRERAGGSRILTWALGLGMIVALADVGLRGLGLEEADLEGIEEHIAFRAGQTDQGGSQITRATGPLAIPMAFVNVLMRPFPGEAGLLGLASGLELWLLWLLVVRGRRALRAGLSGWRSNPFLVLAFPCGAALCLLYGVGFANLGIIARQRVVVLPFLIVLPALATVASTRAPKYLSTTSLRPALPRSSRST